MRFNIYSFILFLLILLSLVSAQAIFAQPEDLLEEAPSEDQAKEKSLLGSHLYPAPDRWRLTNPKGSRWSLDLLLDPYSTNLLKGDFPIIKDEWFLVLDGVLDNVALARQNLDYQELAFQPLPPFEPAFFKRENRVLQETLFLGAELFNGQTVFRPKRFSFKFTGAWRGKWNDQNGFSDGTNNAFGLQEAFFESQLFEVGENFESVFVRVGMQGFNSDFLGLIYNDLQPGIRFFGDLDSNRIQFNLAWFHTLQKDFETGLNALEGSFQQNVFIANMTFQDAFVDGLFLSPSIHYNRDRKGSVEQDVLYLGTAATGVIDRFEVNPALYFAFGQQDKNALSNKPNDILSALFVAEVVYPHDWLRPNVTLIYATGDDDTSDNTANGFDAINDNVGLLSGPFGYLVAENIRFLEHTILRANSFLPSSRVGGASNYSNPGAFILAAGIDMAWTPKLETNFDLIWYNLATSRIFINGEDRSIARGFGAEAALAVKYRPYLNDNLILQAATSLFQPFDGADELFGNAETSYRLFLNLVLTF